MYVHVRRKLTGSYEPVYRVSRYTNGASRRVPTESSLIRVFILSTPRIYFKDSPLQLYCTIVEIKISLFLSFFHRQRLTFIILKYFDNIINVPTSALILAWYLMSMEERKN